MSEPRYETTVTRKEDGRPVTGCDGDAIARANELEAKVDALQEEVEAEANMRAAAAVGLIDARDELAEVRAALYRKNELADQLSRRFARLTDPKRTKLDAERERDEALRERDEARAELDASRGREPGVAGPRDYEFAERIFAGWRERAERADQALALLRRLWRMTDPGRECRQETVHGILHDYLTNEGAPADADLHRAIRREDGFWAAEYREATTETWDVLPRRFRSATEALACAERAARDLGPPEDEPLQGDPTVEVPWGAPTERGEERH